MTFLLPLFNLFKFPIRYFADGANFRQLIPYVDKAAYGANINTRIFKRAFDLFEARMDCLHINEYCPWYEYTLIETLVKDLWKFQKGSRFYFNHQAAIWNIDSLLRIQNPDEEPYENECKGTERAWELNSEHYLLNYAWYKAAYINDKGTLLPIAQDFVRDWKWKRYINTLKNINESTRDSFN